MGPGREARKLHEPQLGCSTEGAPGEQCNGSKAMAWAPPGASLSCTRAPRGLSAGWRNTSQAPYPSLRGRKSCLKSAMGRAKPSTKQQKGRSALPCGPRDAITTLGHLREGGTAKCQRTRKTSGHMVSQVSHGRDLNCCSTHHTREVDKSPGLGHSASRDKARLGQCRPKHSLHSKPRGS